MLLPVLRFEIAFRRRQVSTYLFFLILFAIGFLFTGTDLFKTNDSGSRTLVNSPFIIVLATALVMTLGTIMVSALMGTAIYRDFESNVHELFFTTRLTRRDYLLGRFLGSYVVTALTFLSIPLGLLAGTLMPWVDRAYLGPFQPSAYLFAVFVMLLPNLLLTGALFFVFGALTRSLMAIYVQGIALLVGYLIALTLLTGLHDRTVASLLDPFGIAAVRDATRYWTPQERNTLLIPFTGEFLGNRVLWLGVALGILFAGYRMFSFRARQEGFRLTRGQDARSVAAPTPAPALSGNAGLLRPASPLTQYGWLTRFYLRDTLRSVATLIIAGLGVLLFMVVASTSNEVYGTTVYPVTRIMAESIASSFTLFNLILVTFLAGELCWKERVLRVGPIADALPTATGAVFLAKLSAVLLLQALLYVVLIVAAMLLQATHGFFHFEPLLYLTYLFGFEFPTVVSLALLAFFVHALVNQKFIGHTVMVIFYAGLGALPALGYNHALYLYSTTPEMTYSDMNGFGASVTPTVWFTLYWWTFGALLTVAALLLWVRGTELPLRQRLQLARSRQTPATRVIALAATAAWVATGTFIFWNTNVLNEYHTEKGQNALLALYEKRYKARYEHIPLPRITAVQIAVDLFPRDRRYRLRGTYTLVNKTSLPVTEIPVDFDHDLTVGELAFDHPSHLRLADKQMGFFVYGLNTPLLPGQTTRLHFDLSYDRRGFVNGKPETAIVGNGTFLTQPAPHIGYVADSELTDADARKKLGLPTRASLPSLGNVAARANNYISTDADWIDFDATVTTEPDQIAVAPGYLQREWTENGRRCFHYKMDAPILDFYTFLSARYAVRRDQWTNGRQTVALEIYYDPAHTYNLDRMFAGMKAALDYDTGHYGRYQFRQLRILEFPCYAEFAQSFANTVPYSEGIGFIAHVEDGKSVSDGDIDYPFYVTAHETSHQWWAHQVIGAHVEGSEMLSESLAEYSALMVMEHRYGRDQMREFLRYDLDRYLEGRGKDSEEEQPLMRCQNQAYIHYDKGSLVFYALRDYLGEDRLDAVLSQFVRDKHFQNPPYTTSAELVERLRAALPPELRYLIADLFETITLYDNKAISATYRKVGDSRYRVTLTADSRKVRANGNGVETDTPLHDAIDIGIFAAKREGDKGPGRPLVLEKRTITQARTTFTYEVKEAPARAGIDPYNKLIDRDSGDNTMAVTRE